jgi:outer membrane cobalamin receptor
MNAHAGHAVSAAVIRSARPARATGWIALVAVLISSSAAAQGSPADLADATLEELLRTIVTTASRTQESVSDAPARMHVVTAAQIRRRGYRSLTDVLKDLVDFKVDIAGDQDHPVQLTVQGTRGAGRVIVLLDGVRISSPTNEPLPILANYPVHTAAQIEIVYGPASALYGADAFSAIINIISKDATDAGGLSAESGMGQHGLYNQSASYVRRVGLAGSLMIAGQAFYDRQPDMARFYPADFGGLQAQRTGLFETIFGPMASAAPVSSRYDAPLSAHSAQASFRLGGLQLSLFESQSRASTTPAYTPDNGIYDAAAFNKNTLMVAAGSYTASIGRTTSTSSLTVSRHELDPESGYMNVYSNMKKSYKYAFGSMVKAEEQIVWKPASALTLTTGGTVERFFAIPQGADLNEPITSRDTPGTILDTDIPDHFVEMRYTNTGAYGQLQYAITPQVAFTLGARGDYNTRYGATFNPRAGLVVRPGRTTTAKLLYGTAYLAPSPYQSASHYGSFYSTDGGATYQSDFWHLPNPDLKPQKKQTVEASLLQEVGPSFALSASTFYTTVTDKLQESDPDQAYSGFYHGWPVAYIEFPVNEGDETTYGGTLGVDFVKSFGSSGHLEARAALSVADGRVSSKDADGSMSDLPVGGMAPLQVRLGTDIRWGRWSAAPRVAISSRQRLRELEEGEGPPARRSLAGYSTLDVNLRREEAFFRPLTLFMTVENALDARYRHINLRAYANPEELIGAPQNPRRITVGVQLELPR